jgi:glycosyltransferase involved in cell wall biosynthesis
MKPSPKPGIRDVSSVSVNEEPGIVLPLTCRRIVVAGAALCGSGYPNAWNTLRLLRKQGISILQCGYWLSSDFHLWKLTRMSPWRAALALAKLFSVNLLSAVQLARCRRDDVIYVPYPGIFLLWILSWLPQRWRPTCICDAYITIWDSLHQDRQLGGGVGSFGSRLLLRIESRALRAAARVIVDTTANADHISKTFNLDRHRIHALPLATEDDPTMTYGPSSQEKVASKLIRVLFFGTFVPLQGTTKIAQAIDLLRDRNDLEFVIIGDGQTAAAAEPYLLNHPHVIWLRTWLSIDEIKSQVTESDIVLGIFGGDGKASRVLPLKIYIALAAGKSIVTQKPYGLPDGSPPIPACTTAADPKAIAEGIVLLTTNAQLRADLGEMAGRYYAQHLGEKSIVSRWREWLQPADS